MNQMMNGGGIAAKLRNDFSLRQNGIAQRTYPGVVVNDID